MKKYLVFLFLIHTTHLLFSQNLKPDYLTVSYFGEAVTHPGMRLGATYTLTSWEKSKLKKNAKEKIIQKNISTGPGVGFFYHKDYQTALFFTGGIGYSRMNSKGNSLAFGIDVGYMRTFLPDVYSLNSTDEIQKVHTGYNYFLTSYAVTFGKDLSIKKGLPLTVFIKPQVMYAIPNAAGGVFYFALETGIAYKLK